MHELPYRSVLLASRFARACGAHDERDWDTGLKGIWKSLLAHRGIGFRFLIGFHGNISELGNFGVTSDWAVIHTEPRNLRVHSAAMRQGHAGIIVRLQTPLS